MSVCLSVCLSACLFFQHLTNRVPLKGFPGNFILWSFTCNMIFITCQQNKAYTISYITQKFHAFQSSNLLYNLSIKLQGTMFPFFIKYQKPAQIHFHKKTKEIRSVLDFHATKPILFFNPLKDDFHLNRLN
jgi:hypothetical protein